jgi:hypothetical protein
MEAALVVMVKMVLVEFPESGICALGCPATSSDQTRT